VGILQAGQKKLQRAELVRRKYQGAGSATMVTGSIERQVYDETSWRRNVMPSKQEQIEIEEYRRIICNQNDGC
jgi:hypothetical protein